MDEKKLLDQIRQSASGLTPPESLNPDAIEKLLTQKKPVKKKIFTFYRLAGTAAVFALCAVSFWQVQKIQKYSTNLERQMTENIVSQEADAGTSTADDHNGEISGSGSSDSSGKTLADNTSDSSGKTLTDNTSDDDGKALADNTSDDDGKALTDNTSDDDGKTLADNTSDNSSPDGSDIPDNDSAVDISETQAVVPDNPAPDDSENISVLPTAQSYEEVYSALRESFYYDDITYDDMGVLTSSISSAAAIDATANAEIEMDSALSNTMDAPTAGMESGAADIASISMEDGAADSASIPMEDGTADSASISMEDGAADSASIPMEDGTADSASISMEDGAAGSPEKSADSAALPISRGTGSDSIEIPEPAEAEYEEEMELAVEDSADEESADYSKTNIQEFGVDEADIVKTDGQYIYILRRTGAVTIVDARDPRDLKEVSTIPPADSDLLDTNELYVDGNILNVIATRQSTSLEQNGDVYYPSSIRQTVLYTYDISDRAAPKLSGTAIQDGDYRTSRKNGSFVYLFTSWYPDLGATYQESLIIPKVNGVNLEATDFYLPESLTSSSYLLISSVNTEDPQNILDKKALVSGTSNFYISPENIYIANENWNSDTTMTDIMKFHYEDGIITGTSAGSVKGYLNNSFSLNEYNDSLRVVSTYYDTDYEEQNGLYILDDTLHITGSIENLAEGETIRSARFFGDIGYFVTFRQTDPLFSVDLSDPSAPVVLGELKVSGFSSYLHFYGKDLLLGMGYEADEQTGITSGVKLSMFDVSDPANVTELHRLVIPGVTWCPSIENYKSILIDPQKNIFGFFCGERYLVFSYDKDQGFISELVYDFVQDALSEQAQTPDTNSADSGSKNDESEDSSSSESIAQSTPDEDSLTVMAQPIPEFEITISDSTHYPSISDDNTRGLYIGDTFYLAGDVSVIAFDMTENYGRLGKLSL